MARVNAASDQRPMPVSGSGVILVAYIVPNAVCTGRCPAYAGPLAAVWQTLQLPIKASCAPRITEARSNDAGGGGSTGANADLHANAIGTAPAASASNITPNIAFIRFLNNAAYCVGHVAKLRDSDVG